MKRFKMTCEVRLLLGAMLIVLADWAFSSTMANAGCGDYVTVGGMSAAQHATVQRMDDWTNHNRVPADGTSPADGTIASANFSGPAYRLGDVPSFVVLDRVVNTDPSDRRLPCSGKSCSNGTPTRDIPLPQVNPGQDRWGIVELAIVPMLATTVSAGPHDEKVAAPGMALAIYHPPR